MTPWTAACQAPLSSTLSQSLLKFMSTELVLLCNHLILCRPLLLLLSIFPSIRASFPVSRLFASGGQSTGASASASVLPMNIKHWFPLGLTGLISMLFKGLPRVFSSITIQNHQKIWIGGFLKQGMAWKLDFCTKEKWTLCSHFWALLHASLIRELCGTETSTLNGYF